MQAKGRRNSGRERSASRSTDAEVVAHLAADLRHGDIAAALERIKLHRDVIDSHELGGYLAGLARATHGDADGAIPHFTRVLAINPRNARALEARAIALQGLGRVDEAVADAERLALLEPQNPGAWRLLAAARFQAHAFDGARDAYAAILRLDENDPGALAGRGLTLHMMGRDREAIVDYDRLITLSPRDKMAWHNRAVSLTALDETRLALASFEHARALDPGYVAACDGATFALARLRRFDEAIALCDEVLGATPDHVPAKFMKANALHELKRHPEALRLYDEALRQRPDDAKIQANRGMTLLELGAASSALDAALTALRQQPELALAWRCKGVAELRLARADEALRSFDAALRLSPDDPDLLCGRAIALKELGRFDDALECFDRALAVNPGHVESKANKGALLLLLGRYVAGLPLFEYRWIRGEFAKAETVSAWPEWKGEELFGKRLLIIDEAGLGDVIQYSRYLPMLARTGAKISYACRPSMRALLRESCANIDLIDPPGDDAEYDYCVALCSLPYALGTRLETIPASPRYLRADPARVAHWKERLGARGFKVGLAWHGSSHASADNARAAPLEALAPLFGKPGIRLISLQKNVGVEEIAAFPDGSRLETLGEDFDAGDDAFVDTAAVIEMLDLVISIDTSIAHLAGALGKPVWVALKHVPEWRWLLERSDSPWYPTARLFRQAEPGNWGSVFAAMAAALDETARVDPGGPVLIPGSVGELIDRLLILEIKARKIGDETKRANVARELELLTALKNEHGFHGARLRTLENDLRDTNLALWEIEDAIRIHESNGDFGEAFIELARGVYRQNDRRAALKREINLLFGSPLIEEKSYAGGLADQRRGAGPD